MGKKTFLFDAHQAAGARMVDFAGWDMPLHYGSQIEEHRQVRTDAGLFDVSHMTVVDFEGERAHEFLRHLLANDVRRLQQPGAALYTCMLNEAGGVIDDLIAYRAIGPHPRAVINSATTEHDVAWMQGQAEAFAVTVRERGDLAILAVQGPNARDKASRLFAGDDAAQVVALKPFRACIAGDWFVSRTGYTGEDGLELVMPGEHAAAAWQRLLEAGVAPCGLGARDTLRLEAGLNLYGQDMDESVSPLESGLGWTVAWEPAERDFVGRAALEAQRGREDLRRFVGLVLEGRGVLRPHQKVHAPEGEGELTSGTFSPTLGRAIGLARLPAGGSERVEVDVRGKRLPARVVKPPFVRHGKIRVEI